MDARRPRDNKAYAAARPRLVVGSKSLSDASVVGKPGAVRRRDDPIAQREAANRDRREQAGEFGWAIHVAAVPAPSVRGAGDEIRTDVLTHFFLHMNPDLILQRAELG